MDICNQLVDDYKMKRGNYVVKSQHSGITISSNDTSTSINTIVDTGATAPANGQRDKGGVCDSTVRIKRTTSTVRKTYSIQGESIQTECCEFRFGSDGSLAINVGEEGMVYVKASQRSKQICITSVRVLVQGVQISSRKELVLSESV